jgi:hypothetical protein
MLFTSSCLFVAAALVSETFAHGYVPSIKINGATIPGWDISKGSQRNGSFKHNTYQCLIPDPYTTPQVRTLEFPSIEINELILRHSP